VGKATKAESGDGVTTQPPDDPIAQSRGQGRYKDREQGWDDKPTSQSGASGRS
jgi:hypothetical protein